MPTTIVNLYIEVRDQVKLEQLLHQSGYAFYDATAADYYTMGEQCRTLEDIEASIEQK